MTTSRSRSAKPCVAGSAGRAALRRPASAGAGTGAAFDSSKAWEHLRQQVAIGPRPSGSPANVKNRDYIKAQMAALGIKTAEQPFDGATPLGPIKMVNMIATIPGQRPDRIVLASHFDTKLFRDLRFVGASDGASSTAALLELARVHQGARTAALHDRAAVPRRRRSRASSGRAPTTPTAAGYYVEAARKSGSLKSLRALILLDMIGDRNLTIRRESNSTRWLTDIVWGAAKKLGHRAVHGRRDDRRRRSHSVPEGRRAVARHHRSRLPAVAHRRRTRSTPSPRAACRLWVKSVVAALPEIEARLLKN